MGRFVRSISLIENIIALSENIHCASRENRHCVRSPDSSVRWKNAEHGSVIRYTNNNRVINDPRRWRKRRVTSE